MELYSIKKEIRDNLTIDVKEIEGKKITSLDTYLFYFPLNKVLVYSYLKYTKVKVKLSYLHDIFSSLGELSYFDSQSHINTMIEDPIYRRVVDKYIRNKYIWVTALHSLQPYFFDAKYLLIGEYQKVASECAHNFFNTQTVHYSGWCNTVRESQENLDKFNEFFINKRELEKTYFGEILKGVKTSKNLISYGYNNIIEVYDVRSELTLQIELGHDGLHEINTLFPIQKKIRNKNESKRLATNILVRNDELVALYNKLLSGEYVRLTNRYLSSLNSLKKTPMYKVLKESIKQLLIDMGDKEKHTYFNSEFVSGYFVHNDVIECTRINISDVNKFMRLKRVVTADFYGQSTTFELSSYMLTNDFNKNAEYLLMGGFISVGDHEKKHNMYEYKLLSNGMNDNFSLNFMKTPIMESYYLWQDYISIQGALNKEIESIISKNKEKVFDDTRNNHIPDLTVTTQFELTAKNWNIILFKRDRPEVLISKHKALEKFKRKIEKNINEIKLYKLE